MLKVNPKTSPQPPPRIDELVDHFRKIRKRMEELKEQYERQIAPFEDIKKELTARILSFLDSTGQEMARTEAGTVSASVRHTASLSDPDSFMDYVMLHGAYELLDRRANATACRDFAEEHGKLPPGVKINSMRTINVRAPQS